jgi:hypothetical protein
VRQRFVFHPPNPPPPVTFILRQLGTGKKGFPNLWSRKKIIKMAHAGRVHKTKWEIPDHIPEQLIELCNDPKAATTFCRQPHLGYRDARLRR